MKELHKLFLSTLLFNSWLLWPLRSRTFYCDVTATWLSVIEGVGQTITQKIKVKCTLIDTSHFFKCNIASVVPANYQSEYKVVYLLNKILSRIKF